jgi:alpha-beta hydrolase superfamily lysophospholipase
VAFPEIKAYYDDPLAFHFNTVKQGDEVLKGLAGMPEVCRNIHIPTYFVHGAADKIIRLEGSFELLQLMPAPYKTMQILPGGFHEPHNDWDKEIYFCTLIYWMENLLKRNANAVPAADHAPKSLKRRSPPAAKSAE